MMIKENYVKPIVAVEKFTMTDAVATSGIELPDIDFKSARAKDEYWK